ncbi:MAG: OPT/YSL family transporter [Candidatus Glassbacteria bacterium]
MKKGAYREITLPAVILGLLLGLMMNASFTYSGLVIGFTIPGSMVAAIIGWGVLRGIMGSGTITENNINQTIASGLTITSAGMIFTVPVLFLMDISHSTLQIILAGIAGVFLGVVIIVPLRTQMIDIDRLKFPSGTAVAAIIKSPASGTSKSLLLLAGLCIGVSIGLLTQLSVIGGENLIPDTVNPGIVLGLPPYVSTTVAVSMFSLGAGYLTGKNGLIVLLGGMLAYWILPPILLSVGWLPVGLGVEEILPFLQREVNRPIGVGMLLGGALTGVVLAFPSLGIAFSRLLKKKITDRTDEVSLRFLSYVFLVAFALLYLIVGSISELSWGHSFLITVVGMVWIIASGLIVSESTGLTNWSPISGMALVCVTIILLLSRGSVLVAITIGTAACVAASQCVDIMHDLKTGHLVGSRPRSQILSQLIFSWLGPAVSLMVIILLWKAYGLGEGSHITAPQAQAMRAAVEGILGGNIPYSKYVSGIILGSVLSLTGLKSLGVLMGLAMYLPFAFILPYGIGCIVNIGTQRALGSQWNEEKGIPFAAGILLGDALITLFLALIMVFGSRPG